MNSVLRFLFSFPTSSSVRLRRVFTACGLALFCCGIIGCAQKPAPAPPASTAAPSTPAQTTAAQSTPDASWSELLQRWWQAASDPKSPQNQQPLATAPTPSPAGRTAPSASEIAVLAARHPAWKLADALEQNRSLPLNFEAIRGVSVSASTLAAPGFDVSFPAVSSGETTSEAARTLPLPAGAPQDAEYSAPAQVTSEFDAIQVEARDLQDSSIADFLRAYNQRQEDWHRDYRQILLTALGEEVEAAAARIPSALALVLPSAEMQLEMTNLRLQLLSNVFSTVEERETARTRLRQLMTQWRAALAEQESARSAELRRLRLEEPAELQRTGEARLQNELETIRRTQQESSAAVAAEHRSRLAEDFGSEQARLTLVFPTPLPTTSGAAPGVLQPAEAVFGDSAELSIPETFAFLRTNYSRPSSVVGFAGVSAATMTTRDARAAQIRALRQLAWRDATRQAQMAKRLDQ